MVGERVEDVEERVDGCAVVSGDRVGGGPAHLGVYRLDAVVQERATGRFATRELREPFCDAGVGAKRERDAVGATLAPQQRLFEESAVLREALAGSVLGAAHVARDRRVGVGWEMQ